MYRLAIVEPVHPRLHGKWPKNQFIILYYIKLDEFIKGNLDEILPSIFLAPHTPYKHPYIRNFKAIRDHYLKKIEIIETVNIPISTNEDEVYYASIIKTFWLKIFQRKWRKWREEQKKYKSPKALLNRSIHGKWIFTH